MQLGCILAAVSVEIYPCVCIYNVRAHACVFVCVCICEQLLGQIIFINKYVPTKRVVVSGGWGNGSGLATAYKFVTWGLLHHAPYGS